MEVDRMEQVVTVSEMRNLEEKGEQIGISRLMLMENAGSAIARTVKSVLDEKSSKGRILLVAGLGNNGGDVFAAARHLAYWRPPLEISIFVLGKEDDIRTEEAKCNWSILKNIGRIKRVILYDSTLLALLEESAKSSEVIVSGIFGTGFKGRPRDLQLGAIEIMNRSHSTRISVDIPSGMEADSGACEFAVQSDITVTMHAPKIGMLKSDPEIQKKCGRIVVANIGLPF